MAFCRNCGAELQEDRKDCPRCGAKQEEIIEIKDKGGFLWGLLGCCVPIAGLVLFLVWQESKPKTARATGIGALVCFIVMVVYYIAIIGLGVFLVMLPE